MDLPSRSAFSPEQLETIQAHIDHNLRKQQAAHQQSQHEQAATRAREEAANKSTPAQDEEPRSGDDFADRIAQGVTSALRGTPVQEQKQQPSGTVRTSQSTSVRPAMFDGLVRPGEQMQQKVLVFRGQMCALLGQQDCLEAVDRCANQGRKTRL